MTKRHVHPVYGAGIQTHDLLNMSRPPLPLDQGYCPMVINVINLFGRKSGFPPKEKKLKTVLKPATVFRNIGIFQAKRYFGTIECYKNGLFMLIE